MKEKHFAYKITLSSTGLVCTHSEIEENRMIDLLKEIKNDDSQAIFWIFKQFDKQPKEQLGSSIVPKIVFITIIQAKLKKLMRLLKN